MTARLLLLVFVVGFLAAVPLRGKDKDHYRVRLVVGGPDSIIGETTSYLTRELRRVGDIDVVEDDPHFTIDLLAEPNPDRTYTFSVVVIGTSPTAVKWKHFLLRLPGTTDDLEVLCRKVAAQIDGIMRGL